MDAKKVEAAILEFHQIVANTEAVMSSLDALLEQAPDSALKTAVWSAVGAYSRALDEAYGIGGWLDWWWLECDLGARPMRAGLKGEQLRNISTPDDLVRLVLDDLRSADNGR